MTPSVSWRTCSIFSTSQLSEDAAAMSVRTVLSHFSTSSHPFKTALLCASLRAPAHARFAPRPSVAVLASDRCQGA